MADEQLLVTLGVQDKGATTQIKALNQELKSLDKQYNLASKAGDGFDGSLDGLQKKLGLLEQKMSAQTAKLEAYKKQMDTARQGIARKTEELEKLRAEQDDNTEAIAKTEKQLDSYRSQLKKAENGVKETEAQLELLTEEVNNTNNAISNFSTDQMKRELEEAGNKLQGLGDSLSSAGQSINNAGNTLIGLSAPIVAFASYASKVSIDFEAAMSNVQAISNATSEDLALLEEKAKEMGANTSKSAKEAADAFSYMALAGWDTQTMLTAIEPVLRLSEAGNIDLARTSDLVTDSMSALGLEVEDLNKYLDQTAKTSTITNTNIDALMEAFIQTGGMAKTLKIETDELSAALGILANAGYKGSEAGRAMSTILTRLAKPPEEASKALDKLGISVFDSSGKFVGLENVLGQLNTAFKKLTPEQQAFYAKGIAGQNYLSQFIELVGQSGGTLQDLAGKIENSNGSLDKMAKTMQDNVQGNITRFKSALEGLGIQVGEKLLPHINDLIDGLSGLIEWFSNLDEDTQQAIIRFGLFTAASGGVLKVTGSLTDGLGKTTKGLGEFIGAFGDSNKKMGDMSTGLGKVGSLLSGLGVSLPVVAGGVAALGAGVYAYNEYQDAMNANVTKAREEMSFLEKAFLDLSGATTYSREELEEMGLVYKDFGDNISQEFQDAIVRMTDDMNDFRFTLSEVNLDGVISDEEIASLTGRVATLVDGIEETIKSKGTNVRNAIVQMYNSDGVIDETEQSLIDYWDSRSELELGKVNEIEKAMKEIIDGAKGRELTPEERASYESYYEQLKILELTLQADNSYELEVARQEALETIKTLDLESASELLQEKRKFYDKEIIDIKAHYNAAIIEIEKKNGELTEEEKKLVEDLKAERDRNVANSEEAWKKLYDDAIKINGNLVGHINEFNGEMLSNGDKAYYQRYIQALEHYEDINDITEDGYHSMYNTSTGLFHDLYVDIDETTKKIKGVYDLNSRQAATMSKDIGDELRKQVVEWERTGGQIEKANGSIRDAYINNKNEVVNASGDVIGSFKEIVGENGQVIKSIELLNGKKIKINDNAKDVIDRMKNTKTEIRDLDGYQATVRINVTDNGTIRQLKNQIDALSGAGYGYAIGTSNAKEGIHTVNEKGWELIDAPAGKRAIGLSSGFGGDTAYLPRGTKVKTNLASTDLMMKEIRAEVSRQLGNIDYSNQYYISRTAGSNAIARPTNNSNAELVSTMNIMVGLLAELVKKDTTVQMDGKTVAKIIANDVDEQISRRARVRF